MPLPRLGLRLQIAALGMGGVLVLGLIYASGVRTQERYQRSADESARLKGHVAAVATNLLQARQVETDFLMRRQEALIPARQALIAQAVAGLSEVERMLEQVATDHPLKQAGAIRAGLNIYATRFQNVAAAQRTLGFNEEQGLQKSLREAVHTVETRLREFDQPRLAVLMLMMRRHEKDFMLRGEEKYGDQLRARVKEFGAQLASSALDPSVKTGLEGLIKRYENSFMAYVVGATSLKEEADDLTDIYGRLKPLVAEVERAADADYKQAEAAIAASRAWTSRLMWWTVGLTVLCAGALSLWVGQRLSTPLTVLARAMERLAGGDLDVDAPRFERRDEIGAIARAFAVFHAKMLENRDLALQQTTARQRSEAERRAAILSLADRLEAEVGRAAGDLSQAAETMQASAGLVSGAAEGTRSRAVGAAAASEQTSANVQMVATAAEELSASLGEVSSQVGRSTEVAERAAADARRADRTIRDLAGAAQRIGDVVSLISTVAGQTNLLALNATIEAARAGEAGRGFAVVASEVKQLATQTARATDDIRAQIAAIQNVTGEAVQAIDGIGGTVREMGQIASAIAATVEQQHAATQEIASNVNQAARGTQDVSANIAGVSQDADQGAQAALAVLAAARDVSGRSGDLRIAVDRFLAQVRAA